MLVHITSHKTSNFHFKKAGEFKISPDAAGEDGSASPSSPSLGTSSALPHQQTIATCQLLIVVIVHDSFE